MSRWRESLAAFLAVVITSALIWGLFEMTGGGWSYIYVGGALLGLLLAFHVGYRLRAGRWFHD